MDGAVIKVNNFTQRDLMGSTNKFPRWAIAFKYPPEVKETVLRSIDVAVGRTGVLTPTACFDPVFLAGTTAPLCTTRISSNSLASALATPFRCVRRAISFQKSSV